METEITERIVGQRISDDENGCYGRWMRGWRLGNNLILKLKLISKFE